MGNEVFWLYLLTRLDVINGILIMGSIFGLIALSLGVMFSFDGNDDVSKKLLSYKWFIIPCIVLAVLIPTKSQMLFIISGTGLLEIAKSDDARRIAGKSVTTFEKYLDEMLKEEKK